MIQSRNVLVLKTISINLTILMIDRSLLLSLSYPASSITLFFASFSLFGITGYGGETKKENFASDTGQALTSRPTMLSLQRILIFQRLSSSPSRVSLLMIIHGLIDRRRLDRSSITCFSMEKFHASLLLFQRIIPFNRIVIKIAGHSNFYDFFLSSFPFLKYKLTISK